MATFKYTAIDTVGNHKVGIVRAPDHAKAIEKLSRMGLMVNHVAAAELEQAERNMTARGKPTAHWLRWGSKVDAAQLALFTRQMATLLQAGLPVLRGLEVLIRQEKNVKFKQVLMTIADSVRAGNPLSEGVAQHPKIFDRLYINMIKAGEAGGVLAVVLSRLARLMEQSVKTSNKVKTALVYPVVVIVVAVSIVSMLMVKVVPQFENIFSGMLKGAQLPHLTQCVIEISKLLQAHGVLVACCGVLLCICVKGMLKTQVGERVWGWFTLHVPKFGDLVVKASISRFSRTFGTLLASGVPILQALMITRDIVGNRIIVDALNKVHDRVRDGESLAGPLEQQHIFPTMVTSMIDVGEETGDLAAMLYRIADDYEADVDNAVAGITSLIEPIMIVVLAVVVGVIVIALFLPIVEVIRLI